MRPLIAGNWKMHGLRADRYQIETVAARARRSGPRSTSSSACPDDQATGDKGLGGLGEGRRRSA
jgi:hypothetical protein